MKTLRAKQISMRTMLTAGLAIALFTALAMSQQARVMTTTGWGAFKDQMTSFFYHGLGGEGTQAIGMIIAVVGIVLAAVSFVMHKLNPQSRLPGWFTCLIVAVIGTLLFTGVEPVLKIIQAIRDTVLGWFGFSGFGDYTV